MERISRLEIGFSHVVVRPETGGWKMLADVEGNLTITLDSEIFLDEEYILLLELSVALTKWVQKVESGKIADFYYESMDCEDKPILAFIINDDGNANAVDIDRTWRLYSIWENFTDTSHLSSKELLQATKKFMADLTTYLETQIGLDLSTLPLFRL